MRLLSGLSIFQGLYTWNLSSISPELVFFTHPFNSYNRDTLFLNSNMNRSVVFFYKFYPYHFVFLIIKKKFNCPNNAYVDQTLKLMVRFPDILKIRYILDWCSIIVIILSVLLLILDTWCFQAKTTF